MNERAQRIAIAEMQGYSCNSARGWFEEGGGYTSWYIVKDSTGHWVPLPDYLKNRNAMIAAVLELSAPERIRFVKRLAENIGVDFYDDLLGVDETSVFMCVTAPLDKIAKAYLVAKSKWHND